MLEGGLRVFGLTPPEFVTPDYYRTLSRLYQKNSDGLWAGNLGNVIEFKTPIRTNSLALNDTEHALEKDNRFRILAIGDSFVEAWQVPLEKTFFKRLEAKLDVEVIAMGASGHGSFHALQKLTDVGLSYSPDMVIAFLTDQNDFKDDLFLLKKQAEKQPVKPASLLPDAAILEEMRLFDRLSVLPGSYLNRWMAFYAVMAIRQRRTETQNAERFRMDMAVFLKPDSTLFPEQRQTWKNIVNTTAMNHVRMKRLCEARGIRFMTVFIDNPFDYDPRRRDVLYKLVPEYRGQLNFSEPRNIIKTILSANDVQYLDLNEGFSSHFRKHETAFHYRFDPHWNDKGHALTAEILAETLQKNSQ